MSGVSWKLNCSNCNSTKQCGNFTIFTKRCGKEIFISSAVIISVLLLIMVCLLIFLCCLGRKYRRLKSNSASANKVDGETKGNSFKMIEVGDKGDKKAKNSKQASRKNSGLENFAEAMYATVDDTPETKKDQSGIKKVDVDLTTDADNYDVITHEESSHSAQPPSKSNKRRKKSETGIQEKSGGDLKENYVPSVEYAVPDKAHKSKKQASKEEAAMAATGKSYDKLHHVTSSGQQCLDLSAQPLGLSLIYSQISLDDLSSNTLEVDDKQRRKRGRTSSPPEEPPPLPPPFVDDGSLEVGRANTTASLKQKNLSNTFKIKPGDSYRSHTRVSEAMPLYDDVIDLSGPQPPQEMYINVKR